MDAQRTLRRPIACAGIGLHSGRKVTLALKPAPAGFGIRFRRTDLGGLEIPATAPHVGGIAYATTLTRDGATVDTVEHLLAAVVSSGIDNLGLLPAADYSIGLVVAGVLVLVVLNAGAWRRTGGY